MLIMLIKLAELVDAVEQGELVSRLEHRLATVEKPLEHRMRRDAEATISNQNHTEAHHTCASSYFLRAQPAQIGESL